MKTHLFPVLPTALAAQRLVRFKQAIHVAVAMVSMLAATPRQAAAQWVFLTNGTPPARGYAAMAEDPARGRIVLFGGTTNDIQGLNDTWEWDTTNRSWREVTPVGPRPPARFVHAMANWSNGSNSQVVIFGGLDNSFNMLGDTWTWGGTAWQAAATNGPSPRNLVAIAAESSRQRVLLFGGFNGADVLGDTWAWNGSAWTQLPVAGPSARAGHAMAYDPGRDRIVLFGGQNLSTYFGETWEWDGTHWSLVNTNGPSARRDLGLAFKGNRIVLFGGENGADTFGDTWEWDGALWVKTADGCPTARYAHTLANDSTAGAPLLHGGELSVSTTVVSGETWRYPGGLVTTGCGCITPPSNLVLWLPLDEASGAISANLAPGANNGAQVNNPAVVNGYVARSLCFDGVSQYVNVPDYPGINPGTGNLTIDAWVNRATTSGNTTRIIVDKRDPLNGLGYSLDVSFGNLILQLADASGFTNYRDTGVIPADNQWHFVAVTVNRSQTSGGLFYVDGAHTGTFDPTARQGNLNNTAPFQIARSPLGGNSPWQGCLDEVEMFNRVVTPAEIQGIFNARSLGKCKPAAPVIVQQPQSLTVPAGQTAVFSVTASGAIPLAYNWGIRCPPDDPGWPDCGGSAFAFSAPNLPTLTLNNVSVGDAGGYFVVVTNVYGYATSQVATLTVTNSPCVPPSITHVAYGSGTFTLSFQSMVGYIYEIQYKNSLSAPAWTVLQTAPARTASTTAQDILATGASRFYRVVCQGPTPPAPLTALEPPQAPPAQPGSPSACSTGDDNSLPYLFSGEFHHETKDLVIKGRGMDFVWARKYRSKVAANTAAGNGWAFSYNIQVVPSGLGFDVSDGNGRTDTYHLQPDGTYGADQLFCEGTLSGNVFTLKFPDSGVWIFRPLDGSSAQGRIANIYDRSSNCIAFAYSSSGQLTNVLDTLGRNIALSYNADGFISAVTDFTGRQVTYAYYQNGDAGGSFGDLKSVTSPAVTGTPNGNDYPAGKTVTFSYSKGFGDERLNHNLLTITDAKGQTWLSNTYSSTTNPTDLNFDRLMSQVRGYSNEVLNFYYTAQPPIPANEFAVTKVVLNDRVGNVSEYLFDAMNNLVRMRQFTGHAVPGMPTTETQNRPTGKLRPTDPDFFQTTYSWNADSKPTQIFYPNGNSVQNTYELALNPDSSRRFRGNLRARTTLPGPLGGDQAAITETFVYDTTFGGCCGFNFVTQATDGRGNTTHNAYDSRGNRTNTINAVTSSVEDFEYNQFGQMTAHVLPNNGTGYRRRDVMSYYTSGPQKGYLQQQIVDSQTLSLTTTYEYDAHGNVVRAIDPRGNDSSNVVNQLDQVVREISRAVATSNGPVRYQRDFAYDANNNLAQLKQQNVDENGLVGSNAYFTAALTFDILNLPLSLSRPADESHDIVTQYAYDANRNRTLVRFGEATSGHQSNNIIVTLYDERNLPFREVRAPGDAGQSTTQMDYDANGNLIRHTQGLEDPVTPRVTTYAYDGLNRRVTQTDPMGNIIRQHFDPNGNLVSQRVEGELSDVPGSADNLRLAETVNTFDALNRLTRSDTAFFDPRTQAPLGNGTNVSATDYSDNSQPIRTVDNNGHQQVTTYDTANRPSVITDAKSNTMACAYNANGAIITLTETERSDSGAPSQTFTTHKVYDGLDRLVQTTDNIGGITRNEYDSRNNMVRVTDPRGNVTRYVYDGANRLLQTLRQLTATGDGAGTVTGAIVTAQTWDDSFRTTSRTDDNHNTSHYSYDALNHVVGVAFADGTTEAAQYDVHHNRTAFTDANGTHVTTTYDLLNRPTAKAIAAAPDILGTTAEGYRYDGLARIVRATNDDSVVTRDFDSLGNLTRETFQVVSSGAPTRTVLCTYDAIGNRLSCTYPGGRVVNSTYDSLDRRQTISDAGGLLASYSFFGKSRVERRDYGNGTRADYAYDGLRRMTNSLQYKPGGTTIDARAYVWDAAGNQTVIADVHAPAQDTKAFTYDSVNRLIRSSTAVVGPDITYNLDGVGNRLSVVDGTTVGVYTMGSTAPPSDRQVNQYTTTPFDSRGYDANGNLLSSGTLGLAYDYHNRLMLAASVGSTNGVAGYQTFKYDCFGRRIEKGTTRYYYAGWQEIEEQNATNNPVATYVWGNGFDELVEMDRDGQRRFYYSDDQGSIRKVADAAGNVIEQYRYGDFGQPYFFDAAGAPLAGTQIGNTTLFTGRRYDAETGLYYYRTRYLEPATGRFLSRDAIGIWGDNAALGNGVTYAGNSPWTAVDPMGDCAWYQAACLLCQAGCATAYGANIAYCYTIQAGANAGCYAAYSGRVTGCFSALVARLVAIETAYQFMKLACFLSGGAIMPWCYTSPIAGTTNTFSWADNWRDVNKDNANDTYHDCINDAQLKLSACLANLPNLNQCKANAAQTRNNCNTWCDNNTQIGGGGGGGGGGGSNGGGNPHLLLALALLGLLTTVFWWRSRPKPRCQP